jgi:hypothetical protein
VKYAIGELEYHLGAREISLRAVRHVNPTFAHIWTARCIETVHCEVYVLGVIGICSVLGLEYYESNFVVVVAIKYPSVGVTVIVAAPKRLKACGLFPGQCQQWQAQ